MPTDTFTISATANNTSSFWEFYPPEGNPPSGSNGVTVWVSRFGPPDDNVGALRWDTSSLPNDATITAATLRLYLIEKFGGTPRDLSGDYYDWGGGNLDTSDAISTIASSIFTPRTDASFTVAALNDIVLTDFSGISKTGITAIRLVKAAPPGNSYLHFEGYNESTHPPQLLVTYTTGPPPVLENLSDTFTRTDSTGLGTSDSGHVWTTVSGYSGMNVISNTAGPSAAANCAAQTDDVSGPELDISIKVATRSASVSFSDFFDLKFLLSNPGATETCYRFFFDCGGEFWIQRIEAGTVTANILAVGSRPLASGDVVLIEVRKLSDRVTFNVKKNGSSTDTAEDTSASRLTTAGLVSFGCGVTVSDWRLDDISATTVSIPSLYVAQAPLRW